MEFQFKETQYHISFSFFAAVALFLLVDELKIGWIIVVSILCHEAGHLILLRRFGVPIQRVALYPFGVQICKVSTYRLSYVRESLVFLAGPFCNIVLAALGAFAVERGGGPAWEAFGVVNIVLALFNMVPVVPLDGGQVLLALCKRFCPEKLADNISFVLSCVVLAPLFLAAIVLYLKQGNFTLLLTVVFLLCGLFTSSKKTLKK